MNSKPASPLRVVLIWAAMLALSQQADAQAPPPETDAAARAYELNEKGVDAFDEGRFEDAAKAFAEAWNFSRDESLRKNESLAWFRAGQCEPAVVAGNKFLLVEGIDPADRQDIHSVIANCKVEFSRRAIDADDFELAETMLDEAEALIPDPLAKDRIAGARVDLAAARADARIPQPPQIKTVYVAEPPPPLLEYSLIASGGALIVGTFVYHLVALGWQRKFFKMESGELQPDPEQFDSLRKRVHLARVLTPALYGLGAIAAGTGAGLLFFMEPDKDRGATAWIGVHGEF